MFKTVCVPWAVVGNVFFKELPFSLKNSGHGCCDCFLAHADSGMELFYAGGLVEHTVQCLGHLHGLGVDWFCFMVRVMGGPSRLLFERQGSLGSAKSAV